MLRHLILFSVHYSERCLDFKAMTGHFFGDAGSECRIGVVKGTHLDESETEMHIHPPPSRPHMRHKAILAVAKETGEL